MVHSETHGLGLAMNQRNASGAVFDMDEVQPWKSLRRKAKNVKIYYEPCSYRGRLLPYACLDKAVPSQMVSTLDLAGKGNLATSLAPRDGL